MGATNQLVRIWLNRLEAARSARGGKWRPGEWEFEPEVLGLAVRDITEARSKRVGASLVLAFLSRLAPVEEPRISRTKGRKASAKKVALAERYHQALAERRQQRACESEPSPTEAAEIAAAHEADDARAAHGAAPGYLEAYRALQEFGYQEGDRPGRGVSAVGAARRTERVVNSWDAFSLWLAAGGPGAGRVGDALAQLGCRLAENPLFAGLRRSEPGEGAQLPAWQDVLAQLGEVLKRVRCRGRAHLLAAQRAAHGVQVPPFKQLILVARPPVGGGDLTTEEAEMWRLRALPGLPPCEHWCQDGRAVPGGHVHCAACGTAAPKFAFAHVGPGGSAVAYCSDECWRKLSDENRWAEAAAER
jgi:hypothetical protein